MNFFKGVFLSLTFDFKNHIILQLKLISFLVIIFLIFLLSPFIIHAQTNIPVGTWRTHAAYNSVLSVEIAENKIYAGSSGGLFYYDSEFNNTTALTKLDGFTNTDIQILKYDASTKTLIIAYTDGNIDFLQENTITNLNLIQKSSAFADKQINQISVSQSYAYLALNSGMVVLDLKKKEIKETWKNLGVGGVQIAILGSTFTNDSIFLATSQGVLANKRSNNLQDYNGWKTFSITDGIPKKTIKAVAGNGTDIFAAIENDGVYEYESGKWAEISLSPITQINSMSFSDDELVICIPQKIILRNNNGIVSESANTLFLTPQEAVLDANHKQWIADSENGLITNLNGNYQSFLPNGPYRRDGFKLFNYKENIVAVAGGYSSAGVASKSSSGYYIYSPDGWKNYNKDEIKNDQKIPDVKDFVSFGYNTADNNLYLGSFGNGLLVSKTDGTFDLLNAINSPLKSPLQISAVAADDEGNTWVTNYGTSFGQPSLYVKKSDNTWQNYVFANSSALYPTDLLIDRNGYKWMIINPIQGGGMFAFDEKTNKSQYVSNNIGNGNLPNQYVHSMAMDNDGAIWVGTERGAAVFYNPELIFSGSFDAVWPVFETRYLLRDEIVNAIAVDGGNRKWMGTKNGIWLFSPDGTELVSHFTIDNSPMPSNVIQSIAIQPVTGEVFIATDKGIVSYRGTATSSTDNNSHVKVFPNPVRPGYEGLVSISGLATNAIVKITDTAGRLVYQTTANGGTAIWNLLDYKNRKAVSGIYFVFSALADGTSGFVTKIAVIQ